MLIIIIIKQSVIFRLYTEFPIYLFFYFANDLQIVCFSMIYRYYLFIEWMTRQIFNILCNDCSWCRWEKSWFPYIVFLDILFILSEFIPYFLARSHGQSFVVQSHFERKEKSQPNVLTTISISFSLNTLWKLSNYWETFWHNNQWQHEHEQRLREEDREWATVCRFWKVFRYKMGIFRSFIILRSVL